MSENIYQKILEQVDIVDVISEYIPLSKKGRNYQGICPFHKDTNPSMSVNTEKQIYKCFVCGASGNAITFVSEYEKIPLEKAIEKLAKRLGLNYTATETKKYSEHEQKIISALTDAMEFFQYQFDVDQDNEAAKYATKRGLDVKTRELFKIGVAPKVVNLKEFLLAKGHDEATLINASLLNKGGYDFFQDRLIFGITNEYGEVIAMSGRALGPVATAKYINSVESLVFHKSKTLYNFHNARDVAEKTKEIYVCEGQMDVIALTKVGVVNAVAILGTALTKEHLSLIKNKKVILNFDADSAGVKATFKSISLLLENKFKVSVVSNGEGKDADEILSTSGKDKLLETLANQVSAIEFVFSKLINEVKVINPENISKFIKEFDPFLAYSTEIEFDFFVNKIAEQFKMKPETIEHQLTKRFYSSNSSYSSTSSNYQSNKKYVKPEEKSVKEPVVPPTPLWINYSNRLVKSVLRKTSLIEKYIELRDQIKFPDSQLKSILDYIVNYNKTGQTHTIKPELYERIKTIQSSDLVVIESNEEFSDLVKKINSEFYNNFINANRVKLINKDLSVADQASFLSSVSNLKKKKAEQK